MVFETADENEKVVNAEVIDLNDDTNWVGLCYIRDFDSFRDMLW